MPLYVVVSLVFVGTISLLLFFLYLLVPRKSVVEERLEGLTPKMEELGIFERTPTATEKFLGRLGANVPLPLKDYGRYMRTLIAAGIRKERFPIYMGVKILLAIILPAIYLFAYGIPMETNSTQRIVFVLIFAIIGFLLPPYWLSMRVRKRQTHIF